jgi:GT2 family glycosyltransferase
VGLLDERYFLYWEDVDFCFRIRSAGYTLAVAENSLVMHKESASLRNNSSLLDAHASRSLIRFMRDHSQTPLLSIVMALCGKLVLRFVTFRFSSIVAICSAIREAIFHQARRGA